MRHSGKFVVRLGSGLHTKLVREAIQQRSSLNSLCRRLLEEGLAAPAVRESHLDVKRYASVIGPMRRRFRGNLLAILLFGSRVTGEAGPKSDTDFLIVLQTKVPVTRSLYQEWDNHVISPPEEIWNPHFVHLPPSPDEAGGLWLEVSSSHLILWEEQGSVAKFLAKLQETIQRKGFRRYWSNGHPFWVKSHAEQNTGS